MNRRFAFWTPLALLVLSLPLSLSLMAAAPQPAAAPAAEPIPAPGDFSVGQFDLSPFNFFPSEGAAPKMFATLHEYIGWVNYYWRLHYAGD